MGKMLMDKGLGSDLQWYTNIITYAKYWKQECLVGKNMLIVQAFCNAEVSKNGDPLVCSSSSGRNGLTKNVPAKNPTPTREWRAKVKGLDFMGPIV